MEIRGALDLKQELQYYGVASQNIRLFTESTSPDLLEYLDLVEPRRPDRQNEPLLDGVAESQSRPLLFFVNESRLLLSPGEEKIKYHDLRRILACRGDPSYLARVRPGELLVTPVHLSERTSEWRLYKAKSDEAPMFFSRLAQGRYDGTGEPNEANYVFKGMLNLLNQGADRLAQILGRQNVLSLIGRVLFFRFLCDRRIVTESDTKNIAPEAGGLQSCFDNAANAHATSQWLDQTFNGDFLPLEDGGSLKFFNDIARRSNSVFMPLSAILKGLQMVGAEGYQAKLGWKDFDFAHVPVGLLSQVYEAFCWKWENRSARETSAYYTPRKIAAVLVDEAFDGLPKTHEARVLDPACGAGVFLVLAFRRLYREWWKVNGRPDTKIIRNILEKQLTGFDVSDSALKLTALSLYLTAIELDPVPIPPEKLIFKELNGKVLFNHRRQGVDPEDGPVIGSLGSHVGSRFNGQYDLVLSNPPWTSLSREHKSLATELTTISKSIIERKGETMMARNYQNPDSAPDLPFLWKSTEWSKPSGRIAMVLPARILLKQEDIPRNAREIVFRLIEVTGIINGSNLSDTAVWPKMSQPFLLFFARNHRPKNTQVIRFITLQYDKALNRKGEMRIDSKSSQQVEVESVFDETWLWKALAVGTALDIDVVRRVKSAQGRRVSDYWKTDLGLTSCTGYMIKPNQQQHDASFLNGLPNFTANFKGQFLVDSSKLQPFTFATAFCPRKREVYRAPLVLVKQSPGSDRTNCWAFLSLDDVAFSQDFYGYSSVDHPDGELLAQYLFLFCHSLIWIHYVLMTAPVFGTERRVVYKTDLDDCPIIPLANLSEEKRNLITVLSKRLLHNDMTVMSEIDAFFGSLYGLDELDMEVIRDTLDVCLPYEESRMRACSTPKDKEYETFRRRLESVIYPFFKVLGKEPQVNLWKMDDVSLQKKAPFTILLIGERGRDIAKPGELFRNVILQLAEDTGTTRIIQLVEKGILVGLVNQYRYWTPSRARLLGAEIVRHNMSIFED